MGINIKVAEDGTARYFTADKIRTDLATPTQEKSTQDWVPEDNVVLVKRLFTENGTYVAADEGVYGYSVVDVQTSGGLSVLRGLDPPSNSIGNDGDIYIQDNIYTEPDPWMESLGYKRLSYLGVDSPGPYINLGNHIITTSGSLRLYLVDNHDLTEMSGWLFGAVDSGADFYLSSSGGSLTGAVEDETVTASASGSIDASSPGNKASLARTSVSPKEFFFSAGSPSVHVTTTLDNLYLFAANGGGKASRMYVRRAVLTLDGDTITYYPAMRVSDGEIGMLSKDSAGDYAFLPAMGDGSFTLAGGGKPKAAYYKDGNTWVIISTSLTAAEGVYF